MDNQQQNNYRENLAKKAEHDNDPNAIYTDEGSTLETKEEFEQDEKSNHTKDNNKITAAGVDNLLSNSDGAAGTDRAGTFERKIYGDPELNKGLEAQAKDEES